MTTRTTCHLRMLLVVLLCSLLPVAASGEVRQQGNWPEQELVTLEANGVSRSVAVSRLAEAAGWSLVASELGEKTVHVRVKEQPAAAVLDLLLSEGEFVASRQGDLVSIAPVALPKAPTAAVIATHVAAPTATAAAETAPMANTSKHTAGQATDAAPEKKHQRRSKKGKDRVFTNEGVVGKDEVVKDMMVFGGDVVVKGVVTGDVGVFGGSLTVVDGGFIGGDLVGFGSELSLENGAEVLGEVGALGGSLKQGDEVEVDCSTCDMKFGQSKEEKPPVERFFERFFGHLTGVALFWVFGAILLATAASRVERVREEIATRPWRAMGYGALSLLGLFLVLITLMVTLIGIPLALLAALLSGLSAYVGFCIVLFAAGTLLFGKRTDNPYLLLAGGCAVYLLAGLLPVLGGLLSFGLTLIGIGALVTTRAGGLLTRKLPPTSPTPPEQPVAG